MVPDYSIFCRAELAEIGLVISGRSHVFQVGYKSKQFLFDPGRKFVNLLFDLFEGLDPEPHGCMFSIVGNIVK